MNTILRSSLAVVLAFSVLFAAACNKSLLDRTIVAIDSAPVLIDTFNMSADAKQDLKVKFAAVGTGLKAYVADKSENKWSALLTAFDSLTQTGALIKDPTARQRVQAITYLVRVMFGISSSDTGMRGAVRPSPPDLDKIRKSDVDRLEQLLHP